MKTQAAVSPAVFLDRDGTIIADTGFVARPEQVHLMPGAAHAIHAFRQAGFKVVVASNQSGVARGLFDEPAVRSVNDRVQAQLREHGAEVDAFYYCPYLDGPEAVVEAYRRPSEWRKPAPGMLLAAAEDLHLDLKRSWMIGDAARDVEAGRRAGCRTVLIRRPGAGNGETSLGDAPDGVAGSLAEAAEFILNGRADSDSDDLGSGSGPGSSSARPRPTWREGPHRPVGPQRPDETHPPFWAGEPDEPDARGAGPESPAPAPLPADARQLELLTEIRELLDRSLRRQRQADFSFARLGATLLTMLAATAGVWGLATLLAGQSAEATPRLLLACFLLLASLALAGADRQR